MSAFDRLLRQAVKHFTQRGFTSVADVENWTSRLGAAAEQTIDADRARARVERALTGAFKRAISRGRIAVKHGKVEKFTLGALEPRLRDALEQRMYAATQAVDGDKRMAVQRVLQRFLGLATSGRAPGTMRAGVKAISKAAKDAKAQERRTTIDQTSKLMANLDEVIAADNGSIGGFWDATWDIERNHRPEHAARHDKFYVRRASWADAQGLLRHPDGYMDQHDMPGVLINCRCQYRYVYDLADAPPDALTAKGRRAA